MELGAPGVPPSTNEAAHAEAKSLSSPTSIHSSEGPPPSGMVIQPSVGFGMPLGSLLTNDDWFMRAIGLRMRLLKGL